jgi:hypothetical protein
VWAVGTRTLTGFGTLAADTASAVWAAGSRTLTGFGTLVSDIWAAAGRTLTAFAFTPNLNSAYDAAKTAAQAGDAMTLTTGERTAVADTHLKRDMSAVTGEAARSPLNAFRAIRNKTSIAGSTLTVTKEDDSTTAWQATVATNTAQEPVVSVDPA